ncbi:tRNA glutamyl-Q(34) synthetase GluQRS [Engelhardtia mirabilis]|uniref:Glutamyl-Q tRNA(Asp) synthetase n=1 Tax=Engelhardtia mirabilis TaxID=2528011 RepID=A0A518BKI6_9BACT|nr:Glutamate--tRNA ligase [Planctomycetes bacterium Pla133]QDV01814.1 Glutamate--tRNA ligase [Planctomycetes bacterium Pla86]
MGPPATLRDDATVVGRLAPSPTGPLHLGHARSFLAAWWSARTQGGSIHLRIEDLDGDRCRPEFADAARRDLEWLGLDWDDELLQSTDLTPYQQAVERLFASGDAYPCVCSRTDIRSALSAPHATGGELRYPGTCRGRYASVAEAEAESGQPAGVRLLVPDGSFAIHDALAGEFRAEPAQECGDFLLVRRDGAIAYQLAVVVDDGRQGVTEVVRGDDLLPSAVRQSILQQRLGLREPRWMHLPLVVDAAGRRLAKRDGDPSLAELREQGVAATDLIAWLAQTCGMGERGARHSARDWLDRWDPARLGREPVVFRPDRLLPSRAGGER